MRRKRRTKYTWLPTVYGDDTGPEGNGQSTVVARSLSIPLGNNLSPLDVFTVAADHVIDETNFNNVPLVDAIGSTLFLKRIVGKCDVSTEQNSGQPIQAVHIAAGFFIARVQPDSESAAAQFPIGLTDGGTSDDFQNYSPLANATTREPWIWRRSWTLGNNAVPVSAGDTGIQFFPATNGARSVLDGAHIDAKTARRTQNDERLFFAWQAMSLNGLGPSGADYSVALALDIRILGAVRRQRNRSAF